MKKIYYNKYPKFQDIDNSIDSVDNESVRSCIKDFNNAMLESGLIRTTTVGQLDVDDIPLYDYRSHLSIITTAEMTTREIFYTYDPLIYTFNDELNHNHPLYLKVVFFYGNYNRRMPSTRNPTYLSAYVEISKMHDFSISHKVSTKRFWDNTTNNSAVKKEGITSSFTYEVVSEIYNTKNLFMVNICPYYTISTTYGVASRPPKLSALLNFLLYRSDDGDVILYINSIDDIEPYAASHAYTYNGISISDVASFNVYSYMITNDNELKSNTNSATIFNAFIQTELYSPVSTNYATPSQYFTNDIKTNYDILIINRDLTPTTSKSAYLKVNLPDGSIGKYKVYGYPAYPVRFGDNISALLLRVDDND